MDAETCKKPTGVTSIEVYCHRFKRMTTVLIFSIVHKQLLKYIHSYLCIVYATASLTMKSRVDLCAQTNRWRDLWGDTTGKWQDYYHRHLAGETGQSHFKHSVLVTIGKMFPAVSVEGLL